jgi:hypothetical protein
MSTTRPAESLPGTPDGASDFPGRDLSAELDGMIARADALDRGLATLDARCTRLWVEAEIARLERQNPCEHAALARFADLQPAGSAEWAL